MSNKPSSRISSLKILFGAFAVIPLRYQAFAKALAVPFMLYLAVDSIWLFQAAADIYNSAPWPMFILTEVVNIVLYTLAAVATHRLILLGSSSLPRFGIQWGRHTSQFLVLAFAFSVSSYAFSYSVNWLLVQVQFVGMIFMLIGAIAFSRFLLVFPAAAVSHPISLRESWRLTRNRKLLMILIVFIYPAIIWLPLEFLSNTSGIGYLLQSILGIVAIILTVVLLSLAYLQIVKESVGTA